MSDPMKLCLGAKAMSAMPRGLLQPMEFRRINHLTITVSDNDLPSLIGPNASFGDSY
jgi:hypothetical protein